MTRIRGFEVVQPEYRKYPDATFELPVRATERAGAYDFHAPTDFSILPGQTGLIWTDVRSYMQDDEMLVVNVRSGDGTKRGIRLANTQGWIDADYYDNPSTGGNIGIMLENTSTQTFEVKQGERFAQAKFIKVLLTDDDQPGGQRIGGFGSTER